MPMSINDPVRELLNSVLESRIEVKRIERKLAVLEARVTKITAELTGMPGGGTSDRNAALAAFSDLTRDYYERLVAAEKHEVEVSDFINRLQNPDSRTILKLRYIDCKRWPKVLDSLNRAGRDIEQRQMFELHGRALNEARELYKEIHHDEKRDP